MKPPASIRIAPAARRAIVAHAAAERPLECCGFLVGVGSHVLFVVPMRNAERSAVRYRIDDRAHIELQRALRSFRPRVAILGVYHSHPAGPAMPSETDVAEAHYPEWVHVIIGLGGHRPRLRAFSIANGRTRPVPVLVPARRA